MKKPIPKHINALIARFDLSAQNLAFRGAARPEDAHAILHQYESAREALVQAIEKAISP